MVQNRRDKGTLLKPLCVLLSLVTALLCGVYLRGAVAPQPSSNTVQPSVLPSPTPTPVPQANADRLPNDTALVEPAPMQTPSQEADAVFRRQALEAGGMHFSGSDLRQHDAEALRTGRPIVFGRGERLDQARTSSPLR